MELVYVLADDFGYPYVAEAEDYLMVLYFYDRNDAQHFLDENGITKHRVVQVAMGEMVRQVAPSIADIDTANALLAEVAADGDGGADAMQ